MSYLDFTTMPSKTLTKEERIICWNYRDLYLRCIESYKNPEEADKKCQDRFDEFSQKCPPYWVKHFIRSYKIEKFKEAQRVTQNAQNQNPQKVAKLFDEVEKKNR